MPELLTLHDGPLAYPEALRASGSKFDGFTYVEELGIRIPTTIVAGSSAGPTMLVTSGIHGAEYCGIAAAMQLARTADPRRLAGSLVILHCCNQSAFYGHALGVMPEDGLNLNRVFPLDDFYATSERSTHTHAVAHFLEHVARTFADYHIDVHSGDANEALFPHCYYSANADLGETAAVSRDMALHADMPFAVATWAKHCVYQNSNAHGIPSILMEMGQQGAWDENEAAEYRGKIERLLGHLGMVDAPRTPPVRTEDVPKAEYLDSPADGCWMARVEPGDRFAPGDLLGTVEDFFGNVLDEVRAVKAGTVLFRTSSLSVRKDGPLIAYACQPAHPGSTIM